jgi:hypothetical protein
MRTITARHAQLHIALAFGLGAAGWAAACGTSPGTPSIFPADGGAEGGKGHEAGPLREASSLGDSSSAQPIKLLLTPANTTITVTGAGPVSANFKLQGVLANGSKVDLLPKSAQFTRPDLASVAAPMSASSPIVVTAPSGNTPYGGTGTLQVVYGSLAASANLTVKVQIATYGAGLSATSPGVIALGGGTPDGGVHDASGAGQEGGSGPTLPADPSASILYPYDKTVWPLGLTSPRVMWNAPGVGDVYRVHYEEQDYSYDNYFTLQVLPAQAPLDQATWDHLTASNLAKTTPDPLSFSLSRYDSATAKAYLTSSETWTVAPESLAGAIYYWSVSRSSSTAVGFISRLRPGTGATPEKLYGGECVGCHAVNAKGTVLVGDVDDTAIASPDAGAAPTKPPYTNGFSTTRAWASFDITQETAPLTKQTTEYGADLALTPDGKYVVFGGQSGPVPDGGAPAGGTPGSKYISLADLQGNVVKTSGLDDMSLPFGDGGTQQVTPMMPAFSPDGTKLALVISPTANDSFQDNVLPQVPSPNPLHLTESIAYLSFDESTPAFNPTLNTLFDSNNAAFTTLGPGGTPWNGIAYPSFTPDSTAVAFHVGQYATGCNSFDATSPNPDVSCGDLGSDNGALFIATLAGKTPIRMANADTPPVAADAYSAVEPTFNPVVRGGYSWVVFTSMRQFGNQPWPGEVAEAGATSQLINAKRRLWVAAVDTTIGTTDPSHPAIYMEGQTDTPNMRGFWTLSSCIATPGASGGSLDGGVPGDSGTSGGDGGSLACTAGFQCCSGFCENGMCVDVSAVACVALGDTCTRTSSCCNASAIECMAGKCTVPPPP